MLEGLFDPGCALVDIVSMCDDSLVKGPVFVFFQIFLCLPCCFVRDPQDLRKPSGALGSFRRLSPVEVEILTSIWRVFLPFWLVPPFSTPFTLPRRCIGLKLFICAVMQHLLKTLVRFFSPRFRIGYPFALRHPAHERHIFL